MVLTWLIGVRGLNDGITIAAFLRAGTLPDLATTAQHAAGSEGQQLVALETMKALLAHARVAFPLSVAEVILSGLLVVASGLAMGGRRGSRGLALQAIGANAVLMVASFLLMPAVRAATVDGMLRAAEVSALPPPFRAWMGSRTVLEGLFRLKLVLFDLGPLGLGVLALTRARTKTYFEAVAQASERTEEP
jgi:hypothetical protein